MDVAADPVLAESEGTQERLETESQTTKGPSDPPVSPIASSTCTDNNGSVSTAPEDSDEIWSDAQEVAEAEGDTLGTQQEIEEIEDSLDERASARGAASGVVPEMDELKVIHEDHKSSSEVMTIEEPSSLVASPVEMSEQSDFATAGPPSLGVPSSPTASASMHVGSASLEVPSSSASARAASITSSQSASALDRRQSRRRSTVDVRAFSIHL